MGGLFVRRTDFNLPFYQLLKNIVKIYYDYWVKICTVQILGLFGK